MERHELAVARQPREHVGFEAVAVAAQVPEDARLEDHEAAVDPAFAGLRLLLELGHGVALEDEAAEARRRAHRRQRRQLAVSTVEGGKLVEPHVGDAVAVRQHEWRVAEPRLETLQPAAGVGVQSGVDEVNGPVFARLGAVRDHALATDGDVVAQRGVLDEEAFDDVTLVAERDEELADAVVRVLLHDVPKKRAPTDFDHRLGLGLGLLGEPRSGDRRRG